VFDLVVQPAEQQIASPAYRPDRRTTVAEP